MIAEVVIRVGSHSIGPFHRVLYQLLNLGFLVLSLWIYHLSLLDKNYHVAEVKLSSFAAVAGASQFGEVFGVAYSCEGLLVAITSRFSYNCTSLDPINIKLTATDLVCICSLILSTHI